MLECGIIIFELFIALRLTAPHCSELLHCAVLSIVIAVQHSCNVVNWIQKIVLQLMCHRQLNTITVVIKCRPVTVVGKKCDVAVTAVCLFVYLYLINLFRLKILYSCRWKVN